MLEAGLWGARFVHFLATLSLFGMALFPLYALPRGQALPQGLPRRLRRASLAAVILSLAGALAWLLFSVATMADSFAAAFDTTTLSSVLSDTTFGRLWTVRVIPALLSIPAATFAAGRRGYATLGALAFLLLAPLAGVGHTEVTEGTAHAIHILADGAHLLAAGAWLGGLVALALLMSRAVASTPGEQAAILARFSGTGTIAVATLVASGLVNAWFLVGSIGGLFATRYGQLLLIKIALFGLMIGLAALNRYWLVPALAQGFDSRTMQARLRFHIAAEQILGLLVIAIVSVLGTLDPAAAAG